MAPLFFHLHAEDSLSRHTKEIKRRRTFAIISHPDAGKTTLTEKLLLYGGAIHLAGAVKARRAARHATSDWMELEKERGISVTSSVLRFQWEGFQVNLLDTPGHQDFSEDTYRTLVAADSAVMLLDNRRGVEAQTRKLFDVCKLRRLPIHTFVNKCDRVGEDPLKLLDDVEAELGIHCFPVTWPIFEGVRFVGVYHRLREQVYLFQKDEHHGQEKVETRVGGLDDPALTEWVSEEALAKTAEEVELLDLAGADFDEDGIRTGTVSPTFFGSALNNFGVEPFLRTFLAYAPEPQPRETADDIVSPEDPDFTGFVFKIQANLDPRHRDRMAFVRICSGRYEPGMSVTNTRSGKEVRMAAAHELFGQERTAVDEAWPGDVVGVHDRGSLRIGDTLAEERDLSFDNIPRFSPEHFARIRVPDPLRRKHLDTGLRQLSEEGAAQVFYADGIAGPDPIIGAVGQLQFDVLLHRLEHEYGVEARLETLPYRSARWVVGAEEKIEKAARGYDRNLVQDSKGRPLILFKSDWSRQRAESEEEELEFHAVAP